MTRVNFPSLTISSLLKRYTIAIKHETIPFSNVKMCEGIESVWNGSNSSVCFDDSENVRKTVSRLDKSAQMSLNGAAQGGGLFESTPSAHPHICFPLSHVKKPKHPKHSPFPFHFNRLNTFLSTSSSLQNFNEGLFFANSLFRPRRNGCVNCSSCEQSNGGSDEKDPQNIWIFSNSQCTTCQCHTNKTFLCFCVLRCKVIFISWCHHFFWNVKVKHAKHLPTSFGPGPSFHVVNFEQFHKNLPPHIQHLPTLEKRQYFVTVIVSFPSI